MKEAFPKISGIVRENQTDEKGRPVICFTLIFENGERRKTFTATPEQASKLQDEDMIGKREPMAALFCVDKLGLSVTPRQRQLVTTASLIMECEDALQQLGVHLPTIPQDSPNEEIPNEWPLPGNPAPHAESQG